MITPDFQINDRTWLPRGRRRSWPSKSHPCCHCLNDGDNDCISINPRRIMRRLSHIVVNTSIPQSPSLRATSESIALAMMAMAQWIKKWIIIILQYTWKQISLNYATVSERADLEGSSAIDSKFAKELKNVRYQNYQIRLDSDLFGNLVRMPWSYIFGLFAVTYFTISIIFAATYVIADIIDFDLSYTFWHWLVFSLSITTCLGSETLDPNRAHLLLILISNLQAFISQILLAFVTGIVFARFSRRPCQIQFADKLIINTVNGMDCLQGRLTPLRARFGIFDCRIKLYLIRGYHTKEGEHGVRTTQLPLVSNSYPVIALMLKFTHRLDHLSELRQAMMESDEDFTLVVIITGADTCTLDPVLEVGRYRRQDIQRNCQFANMVERKGITEDDEYGELHVDFNKLNQLVYRIKKEDTRLSTRDLLPK